MKAHVIAILLVSCGALGFAIASFAMTWTHIMQGCQ